jgi:hypothetical protein
MSKYATDKQGDGFILTDFIDINSKGAKNHKLKSYFEPVWSYDTLYGNNIKGTIYDVGGLRDTYYRQTTEAKRYTRILCDFVNRSDVKGFNDFNERNKNNPSYLKAYNELKKRFDLLYQLNLALNTDFNKEPLSNNQLKVLDKMV